MKGGVDFCGYGKPAMEARHLVTDIAHIRGYSEGLVRLDSNIVSEGCHVFDVSLTERTIADDMLVCFRSISRSVESQGVVLSFFRLRYIIYRTSSRCCCCINACMHTR